MISISKNKSKLIILSAILILTLLIASCDILEETSDTTETEFIVNENDLLVHFIDIGQGDATLIELPNDEVALIDGGPRDSSDKLIKYLKYYYMLKKF